MSTLLTYVWWHVGLPTFILTDDDAAYRSALADDFRQRTGVEMLRTAPYSSWELGRVERRHADLNKAMQLLRDKKAWPLHLPGPVAFAYNTLKSVVTNVCPAQVEYGKTPRGPVELKLTPMEDEPTADQRRMVTENQLASHISALQAAQRIYWFVAGVFQQRNRKCG